MALNNLEIQRREDSPIVIKSRHQAKTLCTSKDNIHYWYHGSLPPPASQGNKEQRCIYIWTTMRKLIYLALKNTKEIDQNWWYSNWLSCSQASPESRSKSLFYWELFINIEPFWDIESPPPIAPKNNLTQLSLHYQSQNTNRKIRKFPKSKFYILLIFFIYSDWPH